MAEIVLSYARQDRDLIDKLGEALERKSLRVWWDREIVTGAAFATEIEQRIADSDRVIVSWSAHSRGSLWVKAEALQAFDQGKIAQLMLDSEPPPLPFNALHAIDIKDWRGELDHPGLQALIKAISAEEASLPDGPDDAVDLSRKDILQVGITGNQKLAQWLMPVLMLVLLTGGVGVWLELIPPRTALIGGVVLVGAMVFVLTALVRDMTAALKSNPGK